MVRIIINADDLGISPVVNQAIEEAIKANHISSTTIMANTDHMEEVKRIVDEYCENKSFGVHLNITEGKSLTNSTVLKKAGMIDDSGIFIKKNNFESRIYDDKIIRAVEEEWDAQIYKVLSHGIKISHVDGHHHCHTWYGYTMALLPLLQKYNIQKVRNTYISPVKTTKQVIIDGIAKSLLNANLFDASKNVRMKGRIFLSLRHSQDKQHYEENTALYKKTMYFDSYEGMFNKLKGRDIEMCLEDDDTLELMCHPGHKNYQNEMALIMRDAIGISHNEHISLISYNELS